MSSDLELKLIELVKPLAESLNLDLVELTFTARKKSLLQIFVDKQGGVTLDELTDLNHLVSDMMDAEDPFNGAYTLEVSSPGLDRPLVTERDFWRKIGNLVTITRNAVTADDAAATETIQGEISDVAMGAVTLLLDDDSKIDIAISSIIKANLVY